MKTELWGTFSVKDHIRPRPFVAEVLLYDKLMIPVPPISIEKKVKQDEKSEYKRWVENKWKPKRLFRLLDIIKEKNPDLIVELPWDKHAREDWENLYNSNDTEHFGKNKTTLLQSTKYEIDVAKTTAPNDAHYLATAGLISLYIANEMHNKVAKQLIALTKTPNTEIEPVIAYRSYQKFRKEQSLYSINQKITEKTINPYALFGWEFFVPEDSDKSDEQLLRLALKLARNNELQESRQLFHSWLKQMYEGNVDPEKAKEKMLSMLNQYQSIVRDSRIKTIVRYAAKIAPVLTPLTCFINPYIGVGLSVSAGFSPLFVEWMLPKKEPNLSYQPASLVYDARRFFGKK